MATITGEAALHMRQVLRLKIGTPIVLFDGSGQEWNGTVSQLTKREILVEVADPTFVEATDSGPEVSLLFSLARGSHTDLAVQKVTELGASEIVLFTSERTVAVPRPGGDPVRLDRLERIATDAARQSGRAHVPRVQSPRPFEDVIEEVEGDGPRILLWTGEKERALASVLTRWDGKGRIVLAVGPEGGFTADEVAWARRAGFETAHLGPWILRTETAAIAAVCVARLLGASLA